MKVSGTDLREDLRIYSMSNELDCVYCSNKAWGTDEKDRPLCKSCFKWVANYGMPVYGASMSRLTFTVSSYGAYGLVSDVLTQQGFDSIDDIIFEDN